MVPFSERMFGLGSRRYRLWGRRPASIRDQICRGVHLARLASPQLDSESSARCALVIGAGICGLATAITLVSRGHSVCLIESGPAALNFDRLRENGREPSKRLIAPHDYDWPHPMPSEFYVNLGSVPFGYETGEIESIIADLFPAIETAKNTFGDERFDFRPNTQFLGLENPGRKANEYLVKLRGGGKIATYEFQSIFDCRGFRGENTSIGDFNAPKFWEQDTVDAAHSSLEGKTIVVSGGGDGGLQDCIRVLYGNRSVVEIANQLEGLQDYYPELLMLKDRLIRALCMCPQNFKLHNILNAYHHDLLQIVREYIGLFEEGPPIPQFPFEKPPRVFFYVDCSHFGVAYQLNYFLVLLLAELVLGQN